MPQSTGKKYHDSLLNVWSRSLDGEEHCPKIDRLRRNIIQDAPYLLPHMLIFQRLSRDLAKCIYFGSAVQRVYGGGDYTGMNMFDPDIYDESLRDFFQDVTACISAQPCGYVLKRRMQNITAKPQHTSMLYLPVFAVGSENMYYVIAIDIIDTSPNELLIIPGEIGTSNFVGGNTIDLGYGLPDHPPDTQAIKDTVSHWSTQPQKL